MNFKLYKTLQRKKKNMKRSRLSSCFRRTNNCIARAERFEQRDSSLPHIVVSESRGCGTCGTSLGRVVVQNANGAAFVIRLGVSAY